MSGLTLGQSVSALKDIDKLSPVGAVELYESLYAGKRSERPVTCLSEIQKIPGTLTPEVHLRQISVL